MNLQAIAAAALAAGVSGLPAADVTMELAGVAWPRGTQGDGRSILGALHGSSPRPGTGRRSGELIYEYYWEYAFPQTPTTFALRGDRFKYIYYHGIWDESELYDLATDSLEQVNLARVPAYRDTVRAMRNRLFDGLESTGGMQVPVRRGDFQAAERRVP